MFLLDDSGLSYDYNELLARARSKIPEVAVKQERLELPRLRMSVIGMRTIVHNFKEVADALNRDPQHIVKFLTGEMATATTIQEERAIFQGKFNSDTLTTLLRRYMERFIVCPVCKRPDTRIVKEKRLSFLVCSACGAKSSVKNL
jgi:translation initiation factor 2 subunit 2